MDSYYNKYCYTTIAFDSRIQTILPETGKFSMKYGQALSSCQEHGVGCPSVFSNPLSRQQLDISRQHSMEGPSLPMNDQPKEKIAYKPRGVNSVLCGQCARQTEQWRGTFFTARSNIIDGTL